MFKNLIIVIGIVGAAFLSGCQNDAQTASLIGSLAGAGIGQLAGGDTEGTLIGAAVGAGAGYIFGNEQDKVRTQQNIHSLREDMNTVTVTMTNSNGSVNLVRLRKQGPGYVGTRGEYYTKLPSSEQLRPIYGF